MLVDVSIVKTLFKTFAETAVVSRVGAWFPSTVASPFCTVASSAVVVRSCCVALESAPACLASEVERRSVRWSSVVIRR